jgi:tripartite-type tricarboxylate transporter receptor subunit TctC
MRVLVYALALAFLVAGSGLAQDYPTRPINVTVPWGAGGGTDTASRALAAVLQERLGQPVNVVNRTGGGGVVGHLHTAQAAPDGYSLGAITVEITMMHWTGLTDLTYEDYTPLALMINNPSAVTVRADAPWETLDELIEHIRENPGELTASGTALGGIWDLARIGFLREAGLPEDSLRWVPSQGAAPAFAELLAGAVDVVTAALAEASALLAAGEVRVLGVMADERIEAFLDVPTLAEQGIDWSIGGWAGIAGPAGLPEDVAATLDEAIGEAMNDPEFLEAMRQFGANVQYLSAAEFAEFLAEQDRVNRELLEAAGVIEE